MFLAESIAYVVYPASLQCAACGLTQFHSPLAVKKHVLRLEVTVDDPLLVAAVHRLTDLIQHLEDELCVAEQSNTLCGQTVVRQEPILVWVSLLQAKNGLPRGNSTYHSFSKAHF